MQKSFGTQITSNNSDATSLARREGALEERERQIGEKQKLIDEKLVQLETLRKDLVEKLAKAANMPANEAKKILLEQIDKDLEQGSLWL